MKSRPDRQSDFSGGIQTATSWVLRKANEVEDAINARFNKHLGSITRRNGYIQYANTLQANKRGLGLHEAKFSTGAVTFAAINDSGDTETKIKTLSGSTWSNLTTGSTIDPNTEVQMWDSLDETYIVGQSTSTNERMTPVNVRKTLTASLTRNMIGIPAPKFIVEYGGCLYAINCRVGATVYPDRAYRSSPALGAITFIRGAQTLTNASGDLTIAVDSVRYIKASMALDVYTAGTATKIQDLTVTTVDKNLNTFSVTPQTDVVSAVVAATDLFTIASTTNYPTGTPIQITAPSGFPAPLVANTTYYIINISATTYKLATTLANATAGTAIDITTTGSGTITTRRGLTFSDNDEIWGDGRKGELAYYWNTDYPSTETADFLKIPSGITSDTAITGFAKSNNRLFLFTKGSTHKWDQANFITVFEDIGTARYHTIQTINDWLLWLDAEGQVHARNDSTGQHDVISRGIRNDILEAVPVANYAAAAAGKSKNTYKLCLGSVTVKGSTGILRVCYDFDSNNWARETHTRNMTQHYNSDVNGFMRPYFLDDSGKMFLDEEGNLDVDVPIPFYVKFGRRNQGTSQDKTYSGMYVLGSNTTGASVKVTTDNKDEPQDVGTLTGSTSIVVFDNALDVHGRDMNVEITQNSEGDPIEIDETCLYVSTQEDKFGQ